MRTVTSSPDEIDRVALCDECEFKMDWAAHVHAHDHAFATGHMVTVTETRTTTYTATED